MSKKGFTVIEMMATFILVSVASVILVRLAITVKEIYTVNDLKTILLVKQGNFMYKIYHDMDTKELSSITTSDNTINFNFSNGTSKKLIINNSNRTISYGNYTYKLTNSNNITSVTNNSYSSNDGNIFALNIKINDKLVGGDYGLNIVFQTGNVEIPDLDVFDISSKNKNLVSNGDLLLKNNSNFTEFGNYEGGAIKKTSDTSYTAMTDEFIRINPTKKYKLEVDLKSSNEDATYSFGFAEFDVDYNLISAVNYTFLDNSLTYLDENINKNDTTIKLHNASNWNSSPSKDCQRGIIVWNYKNSKHDIYLNPAYTDSKKYQAYSRNVYQDIFDAGEISNNTINLREAWKGPNINKQTTYDVFNSLDGTTEHKTIRTYVSQTSCGSKYKYSVLSNETIGTSWYPYKSSNITGTITNGTVNKNKFTIGTVYIKPIIIANQNNTPNTTTYINNLIFKEI